MFPTLSIHVDARGLASGPSPGIDAAGGIPLSDPPTANPPCTLARFAARARRSSSIVEDKGDEGGSAFAGESRLLRWWSFAAARALAGEICTGLSMPVPLSTRTDVRFPMGLSSSARNAASSSLSSNATDDAEDCERRTDDVVIEVEVDEVATEDVLWVLACPTARLVLPGLSASTGVRGDAL